MFSVEVPEVTKYDDVNYLIPFCVEEITVGEGSEAVQQYSARTVLYPHAPSLDDRKLSIATELNKDVGEYVYGYYDAGTQQTFQALLSMDAVPEAIKTAIKSIFPWIQSCLGYYYGKKTEILASEQPELIAWDFAQFDAIKPDVSLSAIMDGMQ